MASGTEITLSVTAAAIALSKGLKSDEIALLGAVFTQLGDTLSTISVAQESGDAPPRKSGLASENQETSRPLT
jgi:hypothetical protein